MHATKPSSSSYSVTFGFTLLTLAVASLTVAVYIPEEPSLTLGLSTILMSFTIVLYVRYARLSKFQPGGVSVHPLLWCFLWVLIMFVIPAWYAQSRPGLLREQFAWTQFSQNHTAAGIAMVLIGCLISWLAFDQTVNLIPTPKHLERWARITPSQGVLLALYIVVAALQMLLLAIAGSEYGRDTSNLGSWSIILQPVVILAKSNIVILAFLAQGVFAKRYSTSLFITVISCQAILDLAAGFRKPILLMAIVLLIVAIHSKMSLRSLTIPASLTAILSALLLPINRPYRQALENGGSIVSSLDAAFETTWGRGFEEGFRLFVESVFGRQLVVSQMPGVVLERTPSEVPFLGLENLLLTPILLVPRFIWPDKPVVTRGVEFSHDYLGYPTFVESSSAPTIFGHGYMYAGWLGLILVSLVFGVMIGIVFKAFVSSGLVAVGAALVPAIVDVEREFTSVVLTTAISGFVYAGITLVILVLSTGSHRADNSMTQIGKPQLLPHSPPTSSYGSSHRA